MAKTSKEFKENLKKHIITEAMLGAATFSVNKRAKNYRDEGGADAQYKKEEYYAMKDELLSIVEPICIHMEEQRRRVRIRDYEDEYINYGEEDVLHFGRYYDREFREYVYFIDVFKYVEKYYLYYEFGGYSFHRPKDNYKFYKKYRNLEVVDVVEIETYGAPIDDLMSVQFVKKIIDLINSGDYTYVKDEC